MSTSASDTPGSDDAVLGGRLRAATWSVGGQPAIGEFEPTGGSGINMLQVVFCPTLSNDHT